MRNPRRLRSVDELLELWVSTRTQCLSLLDQRRGEELRSVVEANDTCLYQMGRGERRLHGMCRVCRALNRLTEDPRAPILLESGVRSGETLTIHELPKGQIISEPSGKYTTSGGLGAALSAWIVQEHLEISGLPYMPVDGFFSCGDKDYIAAFEPQGAPWDHGMVLQLLVLLDALRELSFSPGDPTVKGLHVAHEPIAYEWGPIVVVSDKTLRIQKLGRSVLQWKGATVSPTTPGASVISELPALSEGVLTAEDARTILLTHRLGLRLPEHIVVYLYLLSIQVEYGLPDGLRELVLPGWSGQPGRDLDIKELLGQLVGSELKRDILELCLSWYR